MSSLVRTICVINQNLKLCRQFSIFCSLKNENNFQENDWFKKLTDNTNESNKPSSSKIIYKQKFSELNSENKKEVIQNLWNFRKENGLPTPKELNDKNLSELLKCESFTHLTNTMIYMVKEEFYSLQKEQKRLERASRQKRIIVDDDTNKVEVITNYPGKDTFMKRISTSQVKFFNRCKVLSSVINDEPKLVFDFRFTSMHTRTEHVKSLYRQYIEILSSNRSSKDPFQIYFCNYDYNTDLHKKYAEFMELDSNLIFETPKNYTDLFPRENLVYLSREAKVKMTKYDPNKIYIIGSMIDAGDDKFKYYSYSQAKKDGIRCERLPLDDHVKWNRGQKSLNMDHMFNIFLNLKSGMDWRDAFNKSLPRRKINEFLHGANFKK